jgi:hypothetical protein
MNPRSQISLARLSIGALLISSLLVIGSPSVEAANTSRSSTHFASTVTSTGAINTAAIPLGDGYVSTTPKVGYVDSCITSFGSIGGASKVGPWINTANKSWDSLTKIAVRGKVTWKSASIKFVVRGSKRIVTSSDLPKGHTSGVFPIASSDPAHVYDQNPNSIVSHSLSWSLAVSPKKAVTATCTGGGPIGILNDGLELFNALDGEGRDAVAHEVLDSCDEHPAPGNVAHHHDVPSCIVSAAKGSSTLVGYALDGYGIYVERNSSGQLLTNTDLDACHGRVSTVSFNGKLQKIFHYDATLEYPYTVGCFEGTPLSVTGAHVAGISTTYSTGQSLRFLSVKEQRLIARSLCGL